MNTEVRLGSSVYHLSLDDRFLVKRTNQETYTVFKVRGCHRA